MKLLKTLFLVLVLVGCSAPQATDNEIKIVCTTSIVADAIRNLVPENVVVTALMGSGIDPHLYKATQGDLERLQRADIVFYNGLHLEGKMGDVLVKLGRVKPVFAISQNIKKNMLINLQGDADTHDPHIWFDLQLWAMAVEEAKTILAKQYPSWKPELEANFERYNAALLAEHRKAKKAIQSIQPENRVLITAHDAFSYFGRAYGLEVMGLQGISTASEYGLNDVSSMVRYISTHKIPAVFVESSVPKRSIEAVMEGCQKNGHQVKLGGQLYSDALGDAGTDAETLIGAFEANVSTIISGLKTPQP